MQLTVLTYNVHSCRGRDGLCSPERIADVIAAVKPDIVALQEIDVRRKRSGGVNQPEYLAELLDMSRCFYATVQQGDEEYGGALLSRHDMRLVRMGALPGRDHLEPRGAVWAEVHIQGHVINVATTHLGLRPYERREQVDALLGDEWLGSDTFTAPSILCGDFNLFPWSPLYRRLSRRLKNVTHLSQERTRRGTLLGVFPIDHIFVSSDFALEKVYVAADPVARVASDHWPLAAHLRLKKHPVHP
jgi:endonuclease/exonuclease/phosphatase family metal-dependent hydrolase